MAVPDPQRDTSRAEAPARGVPEAYEHYFASGHYDRRYPRPNPTVLRLIRRELPPGGNVIDFGCGSGRYLLALRGQAGVAAGYDICSAALDAFRRVAGTDRRGRSPTSSARTRTTSTGTSKLTAPPTSCFACSGSCRISRAPRSGGGRCAGWPGCSGRDRDG